MLPVSSERHIRKVEITEMASIFADSKQFMVKIVLGTTSKKFDFTELYKTKDVRYDTETKTWTAEVDGNIKDNFSVQVFAIGGGLFGNNKVKVCELWHNTIMIDDKQDVIDFPLSELNVKKKYRKKVDKMALRLHFGGSIAKSQTDESPGIKGRAPTLIFHNPSVASYEVQENGIELSAVRTIMPKGEQQAAI